MKPIYLLLGGIAAFTIYNLSRLAASLNFSIENVLISGGIFKPVVNLFLKVSNGSSQSATLLSTTGEVFINGQLLANFQNFTSTFIQKNNFSILKIEARPNLIGSINIVKYFIKNKGSGVINVEIKGIANVDGNTINFSNKIKI